MHIVGFLEGKWVVADVGDSRVKVEAVGLTDSDKEALEAADVGTPEEERQKARDKRAQTHFDEMDSVDARREEKEKEKAAEEADRAEEEVCETDRRRAGLATEPGTLESVDRIAEAASRLNGAADEATAYVEGVEACLEKAGYGIEVRGEPFAISNSPHIPRRSHIEFAKTTGAHRKWCFVLMDGSRGVPLMRASRTDRILAAKHVPALLEKMRERIAEEVRKVKEGER